LSAGPLLHRLPLDITSWLRAALAGSVPETPKPGEPAFGRVSTAIVARNADAVDGALRAARDAGWSARPGPPLAGEACGTGTAIGRLLRESESACVVSGGECVVRTDGTGGTGGRCMELALAAARELAGLSGVTVLAAGTDGRDGPTDAAGAIVDGETWKRMVDAGVDPDRALAEHDSYPALDAAGSLLRTGPTRTNVMDLVIAIRS
jgi:glycerate-2-kinase